MIQPYPWPAGRSPSLWDSRAELPVSGTRRPSIGWGFDGTLTDAEAKFPALLQNLCDELAFATGADRNMIETLALGFAALGVQDVFDQVRPNCAPAPCSLFTLSLAPTSGFKSTIVRELSRPYRDIESKAADDKKKATAVDRARIDAWHVRLKACKRELERAWDNPERFDQLEKTYAEILAGKPVLQPAIRHIYTDTTWPALVEGMHDMSASAAIVAGEAKKFFTGPLAAYLTSLNDAWDGGPLIVDRKASASFVVQAPRLSLILALQSRPFQAYIDSHGIDADELGFLPRVLVARSAKVDRTGIGGKKGVSHEARQQYDAWVTELHNRRAAISGAGCYERPALPMSSGAEAQWIATYQWLAAEMLPGGRFEPIENYVAKCAENIARIAVIFEVADNPDSSEVSLLNMRRAILVCRRYVQNYVEVFGPMYVPLVERDAEQIKKWLFDRWGRSYYTSIKVSDIQRNTWGGRELRRDRNRIEAALKYLEGEGAIRFLDGERRNVVQPVNQWNTVITANQVPQGLFSSPG